jgi:hypothetical protein
MISVGIGGRVARPDAFTIAKSSSNCSKPAARDSFNAARRSEDSFVTINRTTVSAALLGVSLGIGASPVSAQSLLGQLSDLLTEQRPTPIFLPDAAAAATTRDTVARLFSVELATLPISSSSGGFVYRLNSPLGVVERASDAFGPFFTERVLQNGRGQMTVGLTYQFSNFSSLQGADLETGTFPTNAARLAGVGQPFSVDTLQLKLKSRTVTTVASYGITDRLAVGGSVPFVTVRFSGTRMRTEGERSTLQSTQSGSATGIGDVTLNTRYAVAGSGLRGVAIGADLRLPTGREVDLLGSGKAAARMLGIGSWEEGRLGVNVNGGIGVGGASREIFWSSATTFAAAPRVTIVGEILGRRLSELSLVRDVYQPHPLVVGVETMRWLPANSGVHTTLLVTGAKWNVASSWLLNTNLLIRVTDAGLRARVTPAISLDYDFEQ